jgi:GNAT superfamily N-acetyltransferase
MSGVLFCTNISINLKNITDTFAREGLSGLIDDIEAEIQSKKNLLHMDFNSKGNKRYFLIALEENKIIGTIEYGPASELIQECTNGKLGNLVEVGTVFVHPEYQRQGVGNKLLAEMLHTLKALGIGQDHMIWKIPTNGVYF